MKRIAHLSDLHLGGGERRARVARALAAALNEDLPDAIIVSGDVTDHGADKEAELFAEIFGDFGPRLIVVPGNHDRLGENCGSAFMSERIAVTHLSGMSIVRVDSTGPHNRSLFTPQGAMTAEDFQRLNVALQTLPKNALRVCVFHHHPFALPEDDIWEKLGGWLGITRAEHLHAGDALLSSLLGRCDVVLHGHRHVPHQHRLQSHHGALDIISGGSSTGLGRYRVLTYAGDTLVKTAWVKASTRNQPQDANQMSSAFFSPAAVA